MSDAESEPEQRTFVLKLTKDELTILKYVMPDSRWGDPLKDTYELEDNEPDDPYAVLKAVGSKVFGLKWDAEVKVST